ncbi:hypothetical protein N7466_009555 [Penicillium verhagenii]|uniref:uncharacterized protein n=1 Tax=Penicillium verhagenii TaxID=1562060 RepID=UPI0025452E6E|nr:uncharacterized protein N7466_009555 [Penicillium verhagenii]KAJ5921229.1 hypothetical protein N7466_009555 [Penicillium verhagenii]
MGPGNVDPVDWSVDEVVSFLCDSGPAPWAQSSNTPRPDATWLENTLRENEIVGELLMHVDNDGLKDMGVKAYGHRIMLMKAIQWLQEKSSKYQQSQKKASKNVVAATSQTPVLQTASHGYSPAVMDLDHEDPNLAHKESGVAQGAPKQKRRIQPTLLQPSTNQTILGRPVSQDATSRPKGILTNISDLYETARDGLTPPITGGRSRSKRENEFLAELEIKWAQQDDEEVLPLYGESSSDEEYEEDTWAEVLEDNPDPGNPRPAAPHSSSISKHECDTLLAEYVANKEEWWNQEILPKILPDAHGMWKYFREDGTLEYQKTMLRKVTKALRERMNALQDAVKAESYKSHGAFKRACGALDVTLFDRCHARWQLDVLELDNCPEYVARPTRDSTTERDESDDSDEDDVLIYDTDCFGVGSTDQEFDSHSSDNGDDTFTLDEFEEQGGSHDSSMALHSGGMPSGLETDFPNLGISPCSHSNESTSPASNKRRRLNESGQDKRTDDFHGPFRQEGDSDIELLDVNDAPDHSMPTSPQQEHDKEVTVKTPPLNPTPLGTDVDDKGNEIPLIESRNPPRFVNTSLKRPRDTTQESISDGYKLSQKRLPGSRTEEPDSLLESDDADALKTVENMSISSIEENKNRLHLLAKMVTQLTSSEYEGFPEYLSSLHHSIYRERIQEVIRAMMNNQRTLDALGPVDNKLTMRLGALFVSWYHCLGLTSTGLERPRLKEALTAIEDEANGTAISKRFITKLKSLVSTYNASQPNSSRRDTSSVYHHTSKRRRMSMPKGIRVSTTQTSAVKRKALQDQAREKFMIGLERRGLSNSAPARQAVTFKDPAIYLPPTIGKFIKSHQLAGIQFMWRELCDSGKPQGCLLAHVMGLGKTLQVISLLVTIGEAAASQNPRIKAQVPERLHRSQTIILCPPSLIPNWVKEFECWAPVGHHLGEIRSVTASGVPNYLERLETVLDWQKNGGVLILSYDLLRNLVNHGVSQLSPEDHKLMKDALLNGPNIVVADEAHKLKSENSAISKVTALFKTKSRIAMTGSPLANNLAEYYQMIDWVAPGYMESMHSFKEKFMDPIQTGLYIDSTEDERRKGLIAMEVLKGVLEPKVQRASYSVLASDLPPKTEFLIHIPLTEIQRKAYNIFVEEVKSSGNFGKIWQWLAIMQLCCNHPAPFLKRLEDREEPRSGDQDTLAASSTDENAALPPDLVPRIRELLDTVPDLYHCVLSNRTLLLEKILDESKRVGDKILVFSQSIPTLNHLESAFRKCGRKYRRIDGTVQTSQRQSVITDFNQGSDFDIMLISTRAGGLGLNIHGANRVVIFDFLFNPAWEEQAIGRAYRLGQTKPVFVYRFVAAGTFEERIFNLTTFKGQLMIRVVDQKSDLRRSRKVHTEYLLPVEQGTRKSVDHVLGKDPEVLDKVLANGDLADGILEIALSNVQHDATDMLSTEEISHARDQLALEQLKRKDPEAYAKEMKSRQVSQRAQHSLSYHSALPVRPPYHSQASRIQQTLRTLAARDPKQPKTATEPGSKSPGSASMAYDGSAQRSTSANWVDRPQNSPLQGNQQAPFILPGYPNNFHYYPSGFRSFGPPHLGPPHALIQMMSDPKHPSNAISLAVPDAQTGLMGGTMMATPLGGTGGSNQTQEFPGQPSQSRDKPEKEMEKGTVPNTTAPDGDKPSSTQTAAEP